MVSGAVTWRCCHLQTCPTVFDDETVELAHSMSGCLQLHLAADFPDSRSLQAYLANLKCWQDHAFKLPNTPQTC